MDGEGKGKGDGLPLMMSSSAVWTAEATGIITRPGADADAEALDSEATTELRTASARMSSEWWCILRVVLCGLCRRCGFYRKGMGWRVLADESVEKVRTGCDK
jgi:hypothetical protein